MPRSPQKPRKATLRRRAAVLDAALRCFTRQGIAPTTIADIQKASKASIGSIYHHFTSKDELAGDLYVHCLELYQDDLIAKLERIGTKIVRAGGKSRERAQRPPPTMRSAERGIRTMVEHHLDWVAKNPDRARFLFTAERPPIQSQAARALAQANHRFLERFFAWVDRGVDAGAIRSLPRDLFLAIVVGPAQTYARTWLEGRRRTPLTRARRALADSAWAAVRENRRAAR